MRRKVRSKLHDSEESSGDLARLLELVARNPDRDVKSMALAEGFPVRVVEKFLKTMRTTHSGVGLAVKSLGHQEMIAALTEKMSMALGALDAGKFEAANAQQIAIVFGILAEKRELLQGKPTQIFSFEERKSMQELLPAVLREAQRRGFIMDPSHVTIDVTEPRLIKAEEVVGDMGRTARFEEKLPTERK